MSGLLQIISGSGSSESALPVYNANNANAVLTNAQCTIPCSDGQDQPTHPGVAELNGGNWEGSGLWMAMTPFTGNDNQVENPEVVISADGDTWTVPVGLTNPLSGPPSENYFADTDIELGYDNRMYVVWRWFGGLFANERYQTFMRSSADGVDWGVSDTVILKQPTGGGSPCLLKTKDYLTGQNDVYRLSDFDFLSDPRTMQFRELPSASGVDGDWASATVVNCSFNNFPANRWLWHFDEGNLPNNQMWMLLCLSDNTTGGDTNLYFALSNDRGLTWDVSDNPIIDNNPGGFPGFAMTRIYRATGIYVENSGNPYLDCWVSGEISNVWRIGRFRVYLLPQTP